MAAESGQNSSILIGAVTLLNMGVWEITFAAKEQDTTPFQSAGAWEQHTPTVKGWTAKISGRFDPADTTGQVALVNAFGTIVACTFNVDASHKWVGNASCTGMHPKSDATNVVTMEYDFVGNGACTYS